MIRKSPSITRLVPVVVAMTLMMFVTTALIVASAQAPQGQPAGAPAAQGAQRGAAPPPPPMAIAQVKPGLYVITGGGGNTTVRVTPVGLIVVDTKNRGDNFYNELMKLIKGVSNQPVKYVVITHHHQDHSGNTTNFVNAGAVVIAHENEKLALATYNPPAGKPGSPQTTYAKRFTIRLGGVEARVYHWGGAHTTGDSIVYWPDLQVVSGGDAIVATAPGPDYAGANKASLVEWRETLDEVAKLKFDTVIPGHSAPAPSSITMTRAEFDTFRKNTNTLVARAMELVRKGTPKEQLLAQIKTDDLGPAWNVNTAAWVARLDNFYADLRSAKK